MENAVVIFFYCIEFRAAVSKNTSDENVSLFNSIYISCCPLCSTHIRIRRMNVYCYVDISASKFYSRMKMQYNEYEAFTIIKGVL